MIIRRWWWGNFLRLNEIRKLDEIRVGKFDNDKMNNGEEKKKKGLWWGGLKGLRIEWLVREGWLRREGEVVDL